ncbi:MAG: DUF374 domain-containing protein [Deltaproteobacteria bacterium]|nr:DUF374 domain-containing protein [Deltaproteobacteria bacterium]
MKSQLSTYRVDNVSAWWRPLWLAGSWLIGFGFWCVWNLLQLTCRIRFEGEPPRADAGNYIYSLWHESWFLYFVTFVRWHRRHVWLQHPYAYMKPVHVAMRLVGIGILLGSEGEEGREAARKLTAHLRDGGSTAISPDGPQGPRRVLKKGVLHLARDSGVPILPLRFSANRALRAGWDRKYLPFPWSTITVACGSPIAVTDDNFEQAGQMLAAFMTGPVGQAADSR